MERYITLTLRHDGWFADFHNDEEIRQLFGSTVLPTAYTANAAPLVVLHAIRKLNPGLRVTIGPAL